MITQQDYIKIDNSPKPIMADVTYEDDAKAMPIVVFCHGYKGYKDWGAWNYVAEEFAQAGFFFLKFNFSHNGGTEEELIDFPDLESFGKNTYSQEVKDLHRVIDFISEPNQWDELLDKNKIYVIGHSRGGGIAILEGMKNEKVCKIATWAAISSIESRFPEMGSKEQVAWQKEGVRFVKNGRTQQDMPHYYSFYEDFIANKEQLSIQKAVENHQKSHLIIHGTNDEVVSVEEAKALHQWNKNSKLVLLETNHTFGTKQPWLECGLSKDLQQVVDTTLDFFAE